MSFYVIGIYFGIDDHIVPGWPVWRIDDHVVRPTSLVDISLIACDVAEQRGPGELFSLRAYLDAGFFSFGIDAHIVHLGPLARD